ncbi:MAG: EF-P lysine aminoacylase GenX [Desulfatibacillum sp.]|nr:EF-P lysine aminoacylase GenX [Desulfatibacillum sp.]
MPSLKGLQLRAELFFQIRRFFRNQGFLEVDTPVRIPAPIPEAHIDAVPSHGWFLQTSPESCMKRLLSQGYENIFQICKVFRQEEYGARHLPEFTMLEWYRARADYSHLMEDCENLLDFCIGNLWGKKPFVYQGESPDLSRPWPRVTVSEAFLKHAGISVEDALATDRFDEIMAFNVEPALGANPVFLMDYPMEKAALARPKPGNPKVAERFELYIGGMELANAFSELTDPEIQRERFDQEEKERLQAGKAPYPPPVRFLQALETMPPSAGIALGMDRLAMLFADTTDIAKVNAFTPDEL